MKTKRNAVLLLLITLSLSYFLFSFLSRDKNYTLKVQHIYLDSLQQIIPLNDSLVTPVVYSNVSGLEKLPVAKIKSSFVAIVLPSILIAKHQIEKDKDQIQNLSQNNNWSSIDSTFYEKKMKRYKAKTIQELLDKMGSLPNSIVIAQAALESGWGQSRFFQEANNIFGIWSYNKDEARIRALQSRNNQYIYLRKYEDISQSILDYFETINSSRAYRKLRIKRSETNDPYDLLPHLRFYSEQRSAYVRKLKSVISLNNLTQYDSYILNPEAFVIE